MLFLLLTPLIPVLGRLLAIYRNFSILDDSIIATAQTEHVSNYEWSGGFKRDARMYLTK